MKSLGGGRVPDVKSLGWGKPGGGGIRSRAPDSSLVFFFPFCFLFVFFFGAGREGSEGGGGDGRGFGYTG